jgi:hypothetical protein
MCADDIDKRLFDYAEPILEKLGKLDEITTGVTGSWEPKKNDDPCNHPFEWIGKPFGGCD